MIKNVQIYVPGQKLKVPIHSIKEPEKRKNFDYVQCRNYCYLRLRSLLAELAGLQPERKLHFHAGVCMIPPVEAETGKRFIKRKKVDVDQ